MTPHRLRPPRSARALSAAVAALCAGVALASLPAPAEAGPGAGRDLYVAPPGSAAATASGQEPDGSPQRPFRALQAALDTAGAGDTVHLRGGRYEHGGTSPRVVTGGTGQAPLTIRAHEGERPVMADGCVDVLADHTVVQGVECDGDSGPGIMVKASHVKIVGNTVHNTQGAGIPVYAEKLGEFTDVLIQDNTVYDTARSNIDRTADGGWPFAIGALGANDVRIFGNRSFRNYGEGVNCGGVDGCDIQDNTVHDNFSVNIYVDNSLDTNVTRNFSYGTGDANYFRDGRAAAGIQLANESASGKPWEDRRLERVVVRNNIVSGVHDCLHYGSYEAAGGMKDSLFVHNTLHRCAGTALYIGPGGGHSGTRLTGNVLSQTDGRPLVNVNDTAGITFDHNLFSGGSPGGAAGEGDVTAAPQLTDPGSLTPGGFRIEPASPARDAAVTVPQALNDYFGTRRDARPDIGAHEVTG